MVWFERLSAHKINELAQSRPAILVTGPRQVGKSSLLKKLFTGSAYISLDHLLQAEQAEQNPTAFLAQYTSTTIIDEIQYAPSLFRDLKIVIDQEREQYGRWILTGSQKFQLMDNISESLSGRIAIVELHSLCGEELRSYDQSIHYAEFLWKGGYPELWSNPALNFTDFFSSYIQTYLERDLQTLLHAKNLRDFVRFLRAAAIRAGQLINMTDIAKDVGVASTTIKTWINALEASGIIILLPPYYRNLGKRLIKAPKLYFSDTGLLSHLLDIENNQDFERHLYRNAIWENFVFCELMKSSRMIPGKHLFFYRDQNAVEIDFIIDYKSQVTMIEAKNSEQIDARRLNFKKVAPLFEQPPKCIVACRIHEKRPVELKEYTMLNPLHCTA